MKRLLFLVTFVVAGLSAAAAGAPVAAKKGAAEKPPLPHTLLGVSNGCFVETVAFLDRWSDAKGAEAWARLLQWGAREDEEVVMGHAVAICEAGGALWSWDANFGWSKLAVEAGLKDKAEITAAPVVKNYPRVSARHPTYRHDFPQAPGATLPVAQLTDSNRSVREASLVGAELGKKRPVNVVRFSHGTEAEKSESAAVIFVFHGRYCVYVPEIGTVPFRGRGGVENLRLIRDLLRRAFPGVSGVRKL